MQEIGNQEDQINSLNKLLEAKELELAMQRYVSQL